MADEKFPKPESDPAMSNVDEPTSHEASAAPGLFNRLFGDRKATLSTLTSIGSYALFAGVVGVLALGYQPMKSRAAEIQAQIPAVQVSWPPTAGLITSEPESPGAEPRTWMNAEIRRDLEQLVLARVSPDPFDLEGLQAARTALIGTGWLKDDVRLERVSSGLVRVTGTWRIPAAAVRYDGHDVLVTNQGELLPVKYKPDGSGFKVIVGVSTPAPNPGEAWIGGEVQTGIKLLEYLGSLSSFQQVAAIDLSKYHDDRSLVIVTELGNRILWGGAPGTFTPGEPEATVKLARLAQLYREFGRIDARRDLVDVRLINGVFVHDTTGVTMRDTPPPKQGKGSKSGSGSTTRTRVRQ